MSGANRAVRAYKSLHQSRYELTTILNAVLEETDKSIEAFRKQLLIKPDCAEINSNALP